MLAACQNDTNNDANGDTDQPDTEEVEPETPADDSDDTADESGAGSSDQEDPNEETDTSEHGTDEQESNPVEEEHYGSDEEAINAIEDYREVDQTNVDLGYGIEGFIEGAAGHQYVSWNEGNWLIEIDFPSDPQYAGDTYENGEAMAQAIVEYLESNTLPPPDQRGIIKIRGFNDGPETLIRWQQGITVYEIDQVTADPVEALQIAVDYQNDQ